MVVLPLLEPMSVCQVRTQQVLDTRTKWLIWEEIRGEWKGRGGERVFDVTGIDTRGSVRDSRGVVVVVVYKRGVKRFQNPIDEVRDSGGGDR